LASRPTCFVGSYAGDPVIAIAVIRPDLVPESADDEKASAWRLSEARRLLPHYVGAFTT
jgi:hypothetical protein